MSSTTTSSKGKSHGKTSIHSRIERLSLINDIIKLNIPSETLSISSNDLNIFSYFIRTYRDARSRFNFILNTTSKYNLPQSFYQQTPNTTNIPSTSLPSSILLRQLIIFITFINFNPGYIEGSSLIGNYKNIFTIAKKLFLENIFNEQQFISFLKYTIVLSSVHSGSKEINRNGKVIFVWVIFFFSVQALVDILEQKRKQNKPQPIQCINEVIEFLKGKIFSNLHNINYIRMYSKKIIFSLINQTSLETRETIVSFLSEVYKFGYDKNLLNYFLMKFKDILGSIETDDIDTISKHIEILISHCTFITSMHMKEETEIKNDAFTLNRCFCLSDSPKTGIEYIVSNKEIIKKEMVIVFSFKMHNHKDNTKYPLIVFYDEDSRSHVLNIYIVNKKLHIVGKIKKDQRVIPIDKELEVGKTYVVIIEQIKKMIGKSGWTVYINGETFYDIPVLISPTKFTCRIGFDIVEYKEKDKSRINFPGYIGTVILFKKKVDDEFISQIIKLGGHYDILLFLKGKNTNIKKWEKYFSHDIVVNPKYKEAFEYFLNNDSIIYENLGFYISPLSISQRYVIRPSEDPNKKPNQLFVENIFMKHEDNFNSNNHFETFEEPSLGAAIYTIENTHTLTTFMKYDGIRLLTLHVEYYYNILRIKQNVNEQLLSSISKGLNYVIQTMIKIINFAQYRSIKNVCEGFGFSLAKVLSLMLDYQVLNRELALSLINLLKEVTIAGSKAHNKKGRTLLACRLFFFLADPYKYNMNDFELIGKLFQELIHCLKENNSLVSAETIKALLKFRFVYDCDEFDKFCGNKPSTTTTALNEYKDVQKKYKELLKILILSSNGNAFLYDLFVEIFQREKQQYDNDGGDNVLKDTNSNNNEHVTVNTSESSLVNKNPKHFESTSILVEYKLLKLFYLTREYHSNDVATTTQTINAMLNKKEKTINKDDKTQIKQPDKTVLSQIYQQILTQIQKTTPNISPSQNNKQYIELIKAIIIRMMFEDEYQNKGQFCTMMYNNIDLSSNKQKQNDDDSSNKKRKIGFGLFGKQTRPADSSPISMVTPDFMPTILTTTLPQLTLEHRLKKDGPITSIQLTGPLSIQILKSIYCCIFDGKWNKNEKMKFIKHSTNNNNDDNECINSSTFTVCDFLPPQKNLLLQYISLLKQIDNNDTLFYKGTNLICKYFDSIMEEFQQNKSTPQSKCKFIHLFESQQIFNSLFIYCISYKKIFSNTESQWIYDKLISYIKYCFIYHPKPFIFPFIQSCIYKKVYDISIIIQDLSVFLTLENKDFWKKYNKEILTQKQEIYLPINEYHFIETFRQIIDKQQLKAYEFFNQNNREVANYLIKTIEILFHSVIIYDSNIYFYKEILEQKNKDILHCTLYESAIYLLFSLESLLDFQCETNETNTTSTTTITATAGDFLNTVLCKSIWNGHSICFYLDLYNNSFSYNKKQINQYLSPLQDYDEIEQYMKTQKEIENKNNIGNKLPYRYMYPKVNGVSNNLCFISEYKLTTLYTYILCVKYRKTAGDNVLNDVISHLLMDMNELYNIIDKYPKLNKQQTQVFQVINHKNRQEVNAYDKIINNLQKNKGGTEKLLDIINTHIMSIYAGLSPIMKPGNKSPNITKKVGDVPTFTSAMNEVKMKSQSQVFNFKLDNDEGNTTPTYGNTTTTPTTANANANAANTSTSPVFGVKESTTPTSLVLDDDDNHEDYISYTFYGIYRRDSFSNCKYHCNENYSGNFITSNDANGVDSSNSNKKEHNNKEQLLLQRRNNRELSVKDIAPQQPLQKQVTINKKSTKSFLIINEPEKTTRYSLYDFDFDEAVLCVKRDILLRNFAFFFSDAYFINKKFCNMKNQYRYTFKPSEKNNNYSDQQDKANISYPTKVKNYHHYTSYYPKMFLRPDHKFFLRGNFFTLGHEYYKPQNESQYPDCKLHLIHGLLNQTTFDLFSKSGDEDNNDNTDNIFACEYNANDNTYYGNIRIRKKYLIFQTDTTFKPKEHYLNNTKYLYSSLEIDVIQTPKQVIILYRDIDTIVNRRFVYMNNALEIFCKNGKSYFFNLFNSKYLQQFISKLTEQPHRHWNEKIIDYSELFTSFTASKQISKEVTELSKKWKQNQINTLSYLLQLNKISGRTYNDINQYPIFPWVLTDYSNSSDVSKSYRQFDLPISAQKPEKKEKALSRYENSLSKKHSCHFQIHYSNSSFVNTYMVRLAPFTYNQIKFQTNSFDKPNRQFHSFEEFCALLQEIFDNREMIPEMFIMIEQLYNLNYVNFGRRTSDKGLINIVPSNGIGATAMAFIFAHRIILDSNKVASKLHQWIDNVFGVNQLPDKQEVVNVFPKESYGKFMVAKFMKYEQKYNAPECACEWISKVKAKCNAIISLGQTPCQLFYSSHVVFTYEPTSSSQNKVDNDDDLDEFDELRACSHEQHLNLVTTAQNEIYYVGITSEGNYFYLVSKKVIVKYSIAMKESESVFVDPSEQIELYYINDSNSSSISIGSSSTTSSSNTVLIYNYFVFDIKDGTLFVMCSFHNRGIHVYGSKEFCMTLLTDSYVMCLKKLSKKNIFYSGHKNGMIYVWEYQDFDKNEDFKAKVMYEFIAHEGGVKVINYSDKHDLLLSCGEEGKLMLRKMSTYELISIISTQNVKDVFVHAVISEVDVIYAQVYNQTKQKFALYGYTFNGLLFERTSHKKFLPIDIARYENNILYVQGQKVKYVTSDLIKTRDVLDIKKQLRILEKRGVKSLSKKVIEDKQNTDITTYAYSKDNNMLYCVLGTSVLRIPLNHKHY